MNAECSFVEISREFFQRNRCPGCGCCDGDKVHGLKTQAGVEARYCSHCDQGFLVVEQWATLGKPSTILVQGKKMTEPEIEALRERNRERMRPAARGEIIKMPRRHGLMSTDHPAVYTNSA